MTRVQTDMRQQATSKSGVPAQLMILMIVIAFAPAEYCKTDVWHSFIDGITDALLTRRPVN